MAGFRRGHIEIGVNANHCLADVIDKLLNNFRDHLAAGLPRPKHLKLERMYP